jgi:hypothetical protein
VLSGLNIGYLISLQRAQSLAWFVLAFNGMIHPALAQACAYRKEMPVEGSLAWFVFFETDLS